LACRRGCPGGFVELRGDLFSLVRRDAARLPDLDENIVNALDDLRSVSRFRIPFDVSDQSLPNAACICVTEKSLYRRRNATFV
jgi:hypothetical protein